MVTSQPSDPHQKARDSCHASVLTNSVAPYCADTATENHVYEVARAESRAAAPSNPSSLYRTYLDLDIQLLAEQGYFQPEDEGYTCGRGVTAAHSLSIDDAQPQALGHAAAYKLTACPVNRSTRAPLATIIEQGSYSTLNSHGSLLSVGRFPSTVETASPIRGSRRRSLSTDGKALHDIQEDLSREIDTFAVAMPQARLDRDHEAADPASGTATSLTSCRFQMQRSASSHSIDEPLDHDVRKVKGFIRGVLQNMRGVSRARSRSSSLSYAPIVERQDGPYSDSESTLQFGQQHESAKAAFPPKLGRSASDCLSEGAAISAVTKDQPMSRITPRSTIELSAWAHPPQRPSRSDAIGSGHSPGSLPSVFPYQTATCAYERPFSTPVVHAGTRDVAPGESTVQATTYHHDMFDISAQSTINGIPLCRGNLSSNPETSSVRDMFANQNSSFCSTMSTSYSGTVLGVDLDLQHGFAYPIRRSQSPPAPVWFTPQMEELERQAFSSESPDSMKSCAASRVPCHSITSSALTSLLPIAAATGIVQPNYNTPTISFYSPSGNLIQPDSSPCQRTSSPDHSGSPKITTSYYNRQNGNIAISTGTRPTRPLLLPMTTPPTQRTPLPLHLRHHHNYRHPELSQTCSREFYVTPNGTVKGCDGVVHEDTFTPRIGVFFPREEDEVHRSLKPVIHDLIAEARFYKARFIARVSAQSLAPTILKRKTAKGRRLYNHSTYAREPHINETRFRESRCGVDALGPLTGHLLGVCFCQPHDSAGTSTCIDAARACVTRKSFARNGKSTADQRPKDAERLLPNARVVGSGRHSVCGDTKKTARRDSVFSSTTHRPWHTGTAKLKVH